LEYFLRNVVNLSRRDMSWWKGSVEKKGFEGSSKEGLGVNGRLEG
jgi:hypothetical protein